MKLKNKDKKNKKLAVGYCRYSSDGQREESIMAQQRAIQEYADSNGITILR
jgi:site-specific DNA recombinase